MIYFRLLLIPHKNSRKEYHEPLPASVYSCVSPANIVVNQFLSLSAYMDSPLSPQIQYSKTQAQKQGSSVSFPPQNDLNVHCVRLKRRSHLGDSTKTTAVYYVGKSALHSGPLLDQFTTETTVPAYTWDTMSLN